jgi:hypothetical protein
MVFEKHPNGKRNNPGIAGEVCLISPTPSDSEMGQTAAMGYTQDLLAKKDIFDQTKMDFSNQQIGIPPPKKKVVWLWPESFKLGMIENKRYLGR